MPTQSTHTWSQIKTHLGQMEKDNLLLLLHALNADNRTFLAAALLAATPEEMAEPYRKIIHQAINPDPRSSSLKLRIQS